MSGSTLCSFLERKSSWKCTIYDNKIKETIEDSFSYEWASLPPGRHDQPIKKIDECLSSYEKIFSEERVGKTNIFIKPGFLELFNDVQ